MRHKLTFEYNGTHFSGWQKQPDTRTVQGVAEEVFSALYQQKIELTGQGRTDAGVHARGQIAHADLPEKYSTSRILHAMKGLLPEDAALLDAEIIHPGFHARFDAVSRSYSYTILHQPSPLMNHMIWVRSKALDEKILGNLAALILGRHDFVNFCIPPEEEHATTICTITRSNWTKIKNGLVFEIEGNRFLRHMVRRLVGTMVNAAGGIIPADEFKTLLHGETTAKKGHSAPAKGLVLEKVTYPGV